MKDSVKNMNNRFDIVFVVLVYRNTDDLIDFFKANTMVKTKTIVVVSHYDDQSDGVFKTIAENNGADCILVPNKGYGYGNNRGVEHALSNYVFDYLVISNADVTIRRLDLADLKDKGNVIIAPNIIAASGKKQNPCEPFRPSKFLHKLVYKAYKGNHSKLIWVYYAWCRIKRIVFNSLYVLNKPSYIYAAHGSFLIIPSPVLTKLVPLYNEKMFLMNEEGHLAKKAAMQNIKTLFVPDVVIDHKEDGSISLEYSNEFKLLKQSFIEFYRYWYLNNQK